MKIKIVLFLLKFLLADYDTKEYSQSQKLAIYKDAFLVDGFSDLLKRQIRALMKATALKAGTMDEIIFYRGAMHFGNSLIARLEKSHKEWVKLNQQK